MPASQGRPFCLSERGTVVHGGHALLFVGEQSLDDEWLHARIVQPCRERSPQIVQPPRLHFHAGLHEFGVQLFLAVAKTRETFAPPAKHTAFGVIRAFWQGRRNHWQQLQFRG